jgi:hypothetical protein
MSQIEKMLVASTANIRKSTADLLDTDTDAMPLSIVRPRVGWIVYANDSPDTTPPELLVLLEEAKRFDCDWLMLDCDAEPLDGFPEFDWGVTS